MIELETLNDPMTDYDLLALEMALHRLRCYSLPSDAREDLDIVAVVIYKALRSLQALQVLMEVPNGLDS